MDLRSEYLGLELPHPLMVGASPICDDLDLAKRAEDAGAAALVMHSLFEEQIERENATHDAFGGQSSAEARGYLPAPSDFVLGPQAYLEQIEKLKSALSIPVIASLNGTSDWGWLHYAKRIEEAGADALELNVYASAHDPERSAMDVENELVRIVAHVARETRLPIAVKLAPHWTSLAHLALRLELSGARGLVLFNRFFEPDFDVDELDVSLRLELSTSAELPLRLRWLALLSGRLRLSLAATGGVHTGLDAVKAVLAGAHGVQMVSALLVNGPGHMRRVLADLEQWLEEHGYESLRQAQGSLNLARTPEPELYERGNYLKMLQGWSREPR